MDSKVVVKSRVLSVFRICAVAVVVGFLAANPSPAADGRIIVQFGGFGAPSIEIASMGIGPTPEVPAGVCGFRLEQPDGWDEGWHFAGTSPGDVLQGYSNLDWPEPEFLQVTGPISPGCADNLYLFHTPVAAVQGQEAPANAAYFVADFLDDDDLVWLDGAGEVTPVPEPPDPPVNPPPPPCEFLSDDCGIGGPDAIAPILSCVAQPFQPHCPPPLDSSGPAIGMLTSVVDYGEVAVYFVERARTAVAAGRGGAGRLLAAPIRLLTLLEMGTDSFGSTLRRVEREAGRHATFDATRRLIRAASAHAGRARIEIGACLGALQRATADLAYEAEAAQAKSALGDATTRCGSMAAAATDARGAILRLQAHAMPAEFIAFRQRY